MTHWQLSTDPTVGSYVHSISEGFGHALLGQVAAGAFRFLGINIAIRSEHRGLWWSIHTEPSLLEFEGHHAVAAERVAYDVRNIEQARSAGKLVRGTRAGHADFYVPIRARGDIVAFLVSGPAALSRPSAPEIRERWRELKGRHGHLADAEFASYVGRSLSTLVLEGENLRRYEEMLELLSCLLGQTGLADDVANRFDAHRVELEKIRFPERCWDAVRDMLDERTGRYWHVNAAYNLFRLGLSDVADHALVALSVARDPDVDPVDEAVRRDAFQRASVELARSVGDVVAGKVGDHGVCFLAAAKGSTARKTRKLHDLADRAATLGRRFDLRLHFGASATDRALPVHQTYAAALGAAESALIQGERLLVAEPGQTRASPSLGQLREALARRESPKELGARFDAYLEAIELEYGQRIDTVRGYAEGGFDLLGAALMTTGELDARGLRAAASAVERAAGTARNLSEFLQVYRRAAADLVDAAERPVEARHHRGLRAAVEYIKEHYANALSVETVARIAGFTPNYFSKLFAESEKMTFVDYVLSLRIERAKQLLLQTEFEAARVAKLSGFNSPQYFSRLFLRSTGTTPLDYRKRGGVGNSGKKRPKAPSSPRRSGKKRIIEN